MPADAVPFIAAIAIAFSLFSVVLAWMSIVAK